MREIWRERDREGEQGRIIKGEGAMERNLQLKQNEKYEDWRTNKEASRETISLFKMQERMAYVDRVPFSNCEGNSRNLLNQEWGGGSMAMNSNLFEYISIFLIVHAFQIFGMLHFWDLLA